MLVKREREMCTKSATSQRIICFNSHWCLYIFIPMCVLRWWWWCFCDCFDFKVHVVGFDVFFSFGFCLFFLNPNTLTKKVHVSKCKMSTHHWNRRFDVWKRGDQSRFREQIRCTHTSTHQSFFFSSAFMHNSLNSLTNTGSRTHLLSTQNCFRTYNYKCAHRIPFLRCGHCNAREQQRQTDTHTHTAREILMCLISLLCRLFRKWIVFWLKFNALKCTEKITSENVPLATLLQISPALCFCQGYCYCCSSHFGIMEHAFDAIYARCSCGKND